MLQGGEKPLQAFQCNAEDLKTHYHVGCQTSTSALTKVRYVVLHVDDRYPRGIKMTVAHMEARTIVQSNRVLATQPLSAPGSLYLHNFAYTVRQHACLLRPTAVARDGRSGTI
jgi:hypothetical protein